MANIVWELVRLAGASEIVVWTVGVCLEAKQGNPVSPGDVIRGRWEW